MKLVYKDGLGRTARVRFVGEPGCPIKVKAYDSKGNEVIAPICEKCGWHKNQIIGRKLVVWVCMNPQCQRDRSDEWDNVDWSNYKKGWD